MKTIEQLKAEQAAALAQLEKEIAAAAVLPDGFTHVFQHGEKTSVTYEFKTLREAVRFAEGFPGLIPALEFSGIYGHFCPEPLFNRDAKRDYEKPQRTPLECVAELRLHSFRLSNDDAFQSHAELSFFAHHAGRYFDVTCRIGNGYRSATPYYLTMRPVFSGKGYRSHVARWEAPDAIRSCNSRQKFYSTGSGPEKAVDARFYYAEFESMRLVCDNLGEAE